MIADEVPRTKQKSSAATDGPARDLLYTAVLVTWEGRAGCPAGMASRATDAQPGSKMARKPTTLEAT
jgi:hypothetical protein